MNVKASSPAAVYARKSILKDNNSIEAQISYGKDKLLKEDLVLYEVYRDEISAKETHFRNRPAFGKLLKDAEAGKFKTVVVFRRDRLARSVDEFKELQFLFKQYGIKVLYSNPGEYSTDENSFSSSFIENLIIAMDELEAEVIKERTGTGKIKKRERREYSSGGRTPFGYKRYNSSMVIDDEDEDENIDSSKDSLTRFKPDEDIADNIRLVFEKYVNISKGSKGEAVYSEEEFLEDVINNTTPNIFLRKEKDKLTIAKLEYYIKRPIYCGYMYKDPTTELEDLLSRDENGNVSLDMELLQPCTNVKSIIYLHQWENAVKCFFENNIRAKRVLKPYLFQGLLYCECDSKHPKKLDIVRLEKYPKKDHFLCKKCNGKVSVSHLLDTLLNEIVNNLGKEELRVSIKEKINTKIEIKQNKLLEKKNCIIKKYEEEKSLIKLLTKGDEFRNTVLDGMSKLIVEEEKLTMEKAELENIIYVLEDSFKLVENINSTEILSMGKAFFTDDFGKGKEILEQLIDKVSVEITKNQLDGYVVDYGKDIEKKEDGEGEKDGK